MLIRRKRVGGGTMSGLVKSGRGRDVFAVSRKDGSTSGGTFTKVALPGYSIRVLDGDVFDRAQAASGTRITKVAGEIKERHGKAAE